MEMVFFSPSVSIFLKTVVDHSSFEIRKLRGSFKLTLVYCSVILCLSLSVPIVVDYSYQTANFMLGFLEM